MPLPKHFHPGEAEPRLQKFWQAAGIYHFSPNAEAPVYSIDTPPPTVSGHLHLGHIYSYTHADLFARFRRMKGDNVFYPMGYDDNGLPTERLVERSLGVTARQIGRRAFIEKCLQVSEQAGREYQALWQRLGLSIDWRYTYRTIDDRSRRISQWSFLELYRKGLVYRQKAPSIWCPECHTAIAQAEVEDRERSSEFVTLKFTLENGETLPIATTRPELLPACVAVFLHPGDRRFPGLVGQKASVPLFAGQVPILEDPAADPEKGTGAVMCCTFGDATDKEWWHTHTLPLIEAIDREGRLTASAGRFAGLPVVKARQAIVAALEQGGLVLQRQPTNQTVRVHERCDTPIEFIMSQQWFVRLLDFKEALLAAGDQVRWHPEHMQARYRSWVENLAWDWCISRQRYYGVPFPLWYCRDCGEVMLADEGDLPVDPLESQPSRPCPCGSNLFSPEEDVFDTWATSSLSPQIVGGYKNYPTDIQDGLYGRVFPFSLRPQGHEIIRTWAFYTIAKSILHFAELPWKEVALSGWGIAGEGMGKISKSRGSGALPPLGMMKRYSADAVRYWAASTGLGKDALISEEKIQMGAKLITKLWNVARFSQPFLAGNWLHASPEYLSADPTGSPLSPSSPAQQLPFTPADRWILSRVQRLIRRVTQLMENYDYAAAKSDLESFFWREFTDNYLEMCKQRLYDERHPQREATRYTLHHVLLNLIQMFAPFLPHVTEEIYLGLYAHHETPEKSTDSIHRSSWPIADQSLEDDMAEAFGETLVAIASAVRRYKSEHNLPLGTQLPCLQLATSQPDLLASLQMAASDLTSITRAQSVQLVERFDPDLEIIHSEGKLCVAITSQKKV